MKVATNREALKKHCEEMCYRFKEAPTSGAYSEHRLVLDLLEQTEWVPFNEFSVDGKLPEEDTHVLVCNKNGEIGITYGWYFGTENNFWYWDIEDKFGSVVAWMPLPKPYRKDIKFIF